MMFAWDNACKVFPIGNCVPNSCLFTFITLVCLELAVVITITSTNIMVPTTKLKEDEIEKLQKGTRKKLQKKEKEIAKRKQKFAK